MTHDPELGLVSYFFFGGWDTPWTTLEVGVVGHSPGQ